MNMTSETLRQIADYIEQDEKRKQEQKLFIANIAGREVTYGLDDVVIKLQAFAIEQNEDDARRYFNDHACNLSNGLDEFENEYVYTVECVKQLLTGDTDGPIGHLVVKDWLEEAPCEKCTLA